MTTVDIILRGAWGARYGRGFGPAPLPATRVYLHHSVTIAPDLGWIDADRDGVEDDEERAMRTLDQIGQDRFGGGISYTFAVMPSGRVYEGHGVDRQGAHTKGLNSTARAIVLVGNYENADLTTMQYRAVAELLQHGKAHRWWTTAQLTGGHRDAPGAQTACPGNRAWRAIPEINRLAAGALPTAEVDMQLTDKLRNWQGQVDVDVNKALYETWQLLYNLVGAATSIDPDQLPDRVPWVDQLRADVAALRTDVAELKNRPQAPVDLEQIKQVVREAAAEDNVELADQVVDRIATRMIN